MTGMQAFRRPAHSFQMYRGRLLRHSRSEGSRPVLESSTSVVSMSPRASPSIERLYLESTFPIASPISDLEFRIFLSLSSQSQGLANCGSYMNRVIRFWKEGSRTRSSECYAGAPITQSPPVTYAYRSFSSSISPSLGAQRASPSPRGQGAHRNIANTQSVCGAAKQKPATSP